MTGRLKHMSMSALFAIAVDKRQGEQQVEETRSTSVASGILKSISKYTKDVS